MSSLLCAVKEITEIAFHCFIALHADNVYGLRGWVVRGCWLDSRLKHLMQQLQTAIRQHMHIANAMPRTRGSPNDSLVMKGDALLLSCNKILQIGGLGNPQAKNAVALTLRMVDEKVERKQHVMLMVYVTLLQVVGAIVHPHKVGIRTLI